MHRASDDEPPRVAPLEDFELEWRGGDEVSKSSNRRFDKVGKGVAYGLSAVLAFTVYYLICNDTGPFDTPAVEIATTNQAPYRVLGDNRIEFRTASQYGGFTIMTLPKDADRVVRLLGEDCQKKGYWLIVRHGPDTGKIYNTVDSPRYPLRQGTPTRPLFPTW